jgi:hypothetical protein
MYRIDGLERQIEYNDYNSISRDSVDSFSLFFPISVPMRKMAVLSSSGCLEPPEQIDYKGMEKYR